MPVSNFLDLKNYPQPLSTAFSHITPLWTTTACVTYNYVDKIV